MSDEDMLGKTLDTLDENPLTQVPIEILISVGRAKPQVKELLRLKPNSILALDRSIDDPVELFVGDRLIARGELEDMSEDGSGRLSVRLTEVVDFDNEL